MNAGIIGRRFAFAWQASATARPVPFPPRRAALPRFASSPLRRLATEPRASPPLQPFHLAVPVHNLDAARKFYGDVMKCDEGRSSKTWIDWNLYGHQLVTHWANDSYRGAKHVNAVDADMVPVPHFGICLSVDDFHRLAARLKAAGVKFIIEPHLRFPGAKGEQWTMFFEDPSGNSLEFKALTNPDNLFAKYYVDE